MSERCLGYAEAAEGAARRLVAQDGPGADVDVRRAIRPADVYRHPRCHGRAPRGIGAGIEIAGEADGGNVALGVRTHARRDAGGMALGCGLHALPPVIDAGHRPARQPGRQSHHGLHREIHLAAETAATGRRHNANRVLFQAHDVGDFVSVTVRRLGRDVDLDALADALRPAGLGLDGGVFDKRRCDVDLGHRGTARQGGCGIAAPDTTLGEHVVRVIGLHRRGVGGRGFRQSGDRGQRLIVDRQLVVGEVCQGQALADQGQDRFATKAHDAVGQHLLVAHVGKDPVGVDRHVGRREDAFDPGMTVPEGLDIAEFEARCRVGRTHDTGPERICRNAVGAEARLAQDLVGAIDPIQPGPDSFAGAGIFRGPVGGRVEHRIDDLVVPRAAAQHAAQRHLDLTAAGFGIALQQRLCRQQHAGRADAALGGVVAQEGALQGRQPVFASQAFDRYYAAPCQARCRQQAGADRVAVEQDGTGAAVASLAAQLCAGQVEPVAQHLGRMGAGLAAR